MYIIEKGDKSVTVNILPSGVSSALPCKAITAIKIVQGSHKVGLYLEHTPMNLCKSTFPRATVKSIYRHLLKELAFKDKEDILMTPKPQGVGDMDDIDKSITRG